MTYRFKKRFAISFRALLFFFDFHADAIGNFFFLYFRTANLKAEKKREIAVLTPSISFLLGFDCR